jgi:DUF4097 and DUF4098 domain-containing protein YvlB
MNFDDKPVARATQYTTLPATAGLLDVQADKNGGIRVEHGSGPGYTITACVAAAAATQAEAQRAADAVRIAVNGGAVRVTNASSSAQVSVHLIVQAPDDMRMKVEASNGPIGIKDVSGEISARAANGPIGVENVGGTLTARADNGPISVKGGRGTFDVAAANGPVSVALTGHRWDGTLAARADNGPVSIDVPDGYQSGIEVSGSAHTRLTCFLSECRSNVMTTSGERQLVRLGPDPVAVRIQTGNGPVTLGRRGR